jgi:RHS repeat-associated protein
MPMNIERWNGFSVTNGANQSLFAYDGLGRRAQDIEWQNGTAVSTNKFLWDGQGLCEERDNIGGTVVKRFFGEGEQMSGTNYYFTRDHLGSIREMTDSSGTIQARYGYDPYGRMTQISGSLSADFGYAGMYYHAPSGLFLTLYRAYDSDLGRWLNRDPLAQQGGLNLYAYVANNPINEFDLLGLENTATQGAETVSFLGEANNVIAETSGIGNWTVGINNANPSLVTVYTSGRFFGNQSTTYAGTVGTFAKFTSTSLTIFGIGYSLDQALTGQESWGQANESIGVSGSAWLLGGPEGALIGGVYFIAGDAINEDAEQSFQLFTDWYYGVPTDWWDDSADPTDWWDGSADSCNQ